MTQPLAGVRVLELATGIAGPYAGKLLADFGADVIKAEPPGGDESRQWGPFLGGLPDPDRSALFLHLNTNKRAITIDPATSDGQQLVRQIIPMVDICIESFVPGSLAAWGLGIEALHELNPSLVLTSVTPFGQDGPYAAYRGSELVYAAFGGLDFTRAGDGHPVMLGGNLSQYHAGTLAAAATMGALLFAEGGGAGTHVDTSIMGAEAGSADSTIVYLTAHAYNGRTSTPRSGPGAQTTGLGPMPNGTFRCADGPVSVSTMPQWVPRMLRAVGDTELSELFADPAQLAVPETVAAIHDRVTAWFADRTRREAMMQAQAAGWPVTAIQSPAELVDDPHLTERGAIVEVDHPIAGRVTQLGPPLRLDDGWKVRRPAPGLGEHDAEVRRELDSEAARPVADHAVGIVRGESASSLPLAGVRVIDMTVAWSGPYVTMLLADLGAEVIRVENPWIFPASTRGVFPRPPAEAVAGATNLNMSGYPDLDPGDRPWNRSAIFNWHGRNKRSMTLDLRKESGRDVFLRLVDESDVLVENNAPNTLDRLGIDHQRLVERNPQLVALRMPSGGLSGPYRDFIGFGSSFEGLVGLRSFRGVPGTTPEEAPMSLHMDAAAGTTGAFGAMVALRRVRREGAGGLVELSQIENLAQHIGEIVMAAAAGFEAVPQGNRDGRHAPQGVYRCEGEDRWVAISVASDEEWKGMRRAMDDPGWAADPRFATVDRRIEAADELDERIASWTASLDRHEVFHRCQAHGVAAAPVADEADLYADPQLRHRGFFRSMWSPHTGEHEYPGHVVRWSGPPLRWDGPSPGLGDDNEYVYREVIGVGDDEYERLRGDGHISSDYLDAHGRPL